MERIGAYELLEQLGRGGMGTVYRARHTTLGREVALKVMGPPPDRSRRDQWHQRFEREIRAAAKLDHPNVVRVHEVVEEPNRLAIAMELIEGRTLRDELEAGRTLAPRAALELIAKLASALAHAHERGVLHRDLKPDNVIVDTAGEPHIIDFGLAKDLEDPTAARLTLSGAILGTPVYLSPEQARGQVERLDARTDVHALGLILYEVLSGSPPFWAPSMLALLQKITDEVPAAPRLPDGRRSGRAGELALWALEKDPARRPRSARAFAEACSMAARPPSSRALGFRVATSACAVVVLASVALTVAHRENETAAPDAASPVASAGTSRPARDDVAALASRLDRALGRDASAVARLLPELAAAVPEAGARVALAAVIARRGPGAYSSLLTEPSRVGREDLELASLACWIDPELPTGTPNLEPAENELARALAQVTLVRLEKARALEGEPWARAVEEALRSADALARLRWPAPQTVGEALAHTRETARLSTSTVGASLVVRLHAVLLQSGYFSLHVVRADSTDDIASAASDLAQERPDDPVLALGCARAALDAAGYDLAHVGPAEKPERARVIRNLLSRKTTPLLERFRAWAKGRTDARAGQLSAIERLEWAQAVSAGSVAPAREEARLVEAIAAYREGSSGAYPYRWLAELQLAKCFLTRLLDPMSPERLASDATEAVEHARAAIAAAAEARASGQREPLELFGGTDVAELLYDPVGQAEAFWCEAEAWRWLQNAPTGDPARALDAEIEALRAGLAIVPRYALQRAYLAKALWRRGHAAEATAEADRALAETSLEWQASVERKDLERERAQRAASAR